MHDIGEGVIPYDIIEYSKLFNLEVLNNRLGGFNFGMIDSRNWPTFLTKKKLKNCKLRFSASEQFLFCASLVDSTWALMRNRGVYRVLSLISFQLKNIS